MKALRLFLPLVLVVTAAICQAAEALPQVTRVVGPPRGAPLAGETLERETKRIGSLVRCPVCQGLSIADSPASMAVNMKGEVRNMLSAGYDEKQILSYFEKSYGEFVLLEPPRRGVNWLVWFAPLLGLLAGAWIIRSRVARRAAAVETESEALPVIEPDLLPWLERVREIAYGKTSR